MNIQVSGLFDSVLNRLSYATLLDTGQWINPLAQSFFFLQKGHEFEPSCALISPLYVAKKKKKIRMAYSVKIL